MINQKQFLTEIVDPTLKMAGLYSESASFLLFGTAMIESGLTYIRQLAGGPALGVYQMEEATYKDLLRYINRAGNPGLKDRLLAVAYYSGWPPFPAVQHNLVWATLMARLKYFMNPEPIPSINNTAAIAGYYKKWYNTKYGKTELANAIAVFDSLLVPYQLAMGIA